MVRWKNLKGNERVKSENMEKSASVKMRMMNLIKEVKRRSNQENKVELS